MTSLQQRLHKSKLNPPAVLAIGFFSLIIIGSFLLNLSMATKTGESVGYIDALFTSSSAVCVTGLVVVNTGEFWSLFGQIVIIIMIQIGGLGFMTMATLVALILGKKINLKERLIIKEQLNQSTMSGLVRLTKYVILLTLAVEGIGAILLATKFVPIYGIGKGIWFSAFHAISAFCNAGFDITGNSMVPFVNDLGINIIISLFIIFGGIGFSVIFDVSKHRKFSKLSLHSKLVLTITIILLLSGTIIFYLIEMNNPATLGALKEGSKFIASFFQSVVTRTAGFNSLDIGSIKDTSAFLFIIFMFIGAGPASTGGGVKLTTFGVIILAALTSVKGERDVVAFKNRISNDIVRKSLAIVTISITLIIIVSFILTVTEDVVFLELLFEATSAFGTVGLSRGITPNLSNVGKIIIMSTMYIGRVGPLTMAFAFAQRRNKRNYRYSEGNIMVG